MARIGERDLAKKRKRAQLYRYMRDRRRHRAVITSVAAIILISLVSSLLWMNAHTEMTPNQIVAMGSTWNSCVFRGASEFSTTASVEGVVPQRHRMIPIADSTGDDRKGCKATLSWPVKPTHIASRYKAPRSAWSTGHRGVDLTAVPGTPLLAPDTGIISFAGNVAGKDVVSIKAKAFTLTFEPAKTAFVVGTPVVKNTPFGTVGGVSDHCTSTCVHWGVRRAIHDYTDPELLASHQKIVLKDPDTAQ